jgi:hypothetical protein
MKTPEICEDDLRRQLVRDHRNLNGIDFVEVSDDQLSLQVYFLDKAPQGIHSENIIICGGRRVTDIEVIDIDVCRMPDKDLDDCLKIFVNKPGDFSDYTLRFVELDKQGRPTGKPFPGFDPRFAEIVFSFKAGCKNDLDCLQQEICSPAPLPQPEISYLAKDYASFRQLMLDRLSLIMPEWRERHVPDIGITLVEVLAYVGDHLSYFQDAVATEAYLDTARQRTSVRRHARLVDYRMHEGCNARAWVFVETHGPLPPLKRDEFAFLTGHNGALPESARMLSREALRKLNLPVGWYEVFEAMGTGDIQLYEAHNEIHFYTWADFECCLPRGATSATLTDEYLPTPPPPDDDSAEKYERKDHPEQQSAKHQRPPQDRKTPPKRKLNLRIDDVLIFEEVVSPTTGKRADADIAHRHAVRLTKVKPGEDKLTGQLIVEIEWAEEDALPFPLCLSAVSAAPDCETLENVSIARGNIILVDHGRTIGRKVVDDENVEDLGTVPVKETPAECGDTDCAPEVSIIPGRYRPRLKEGPLTFSQPLPQKREDIGCPPLEVSATNLLRQDARLALPQIALTSVTGGTAAATSWEPRYDLLGSGSEDNHFVVEMDNRQRAHLRFGDGELGRAPLAGEHFTASYRVGNGAAGNAGPEAISHIVLKNSISGVQLAPRNPMPAVGGTEPERIEEVKLFAPFSFRTDLQRAITAEDYATLASRHPRVQRAAAMLRWTGAWYEVLVAVDPRERAEADEKLLTEVECLLRPFRRIGHELNVVKADYVPLDISMTVCVKPGYLRGHIKAALLQLFGNRALLDGRLGFFHPDSLTFGTGVLVSKLVATAQSVTGVENVVVTRLQRLNETAGRELADGLLRLGPREIARLDNDPNSPENGKIEFVMGGGR